MTTHDSATTEAPVVGALRRLSVFSADQGGAYREHFASLASILGPDVQTKLALFLQDWSRSARPGVVILTGNAGTGKTAAAEAYCAAAGSPLPPVDTLQECSAGKWVLKDLSGVSTAEQRAQTLADALLRGTSGQALVCANEGILRDALSDLGDDVSLGALDDALRSGAARRGGLTVVNVNRQRPSAPRLWAAMLDYVSRPDLWEGCTGCPFADGGCPMRTNAEKLRDPDVREQLRTLFRIASGEAVPTLREVLAILSWAVVGNSTCQITRNAFRDLGPASTTAGDAYFARVLGAGLSAEVAERSPLMRGLAAAGLGQVSDLEVDGWLRDTSGQGEAVRDLAGAPPSRDEEGGPGPARGLDGSRSPLDRVKTKQQPMTFHALGEMISTAEDPAKVEDGLLALVSGDDTVPSAQAMWRRRVFFEAPATLGGPQRACRRLLRFRHASRLCDLAADVASGGDVVLQIGELVRGLNFLVTGFPSADEGMIVPDPACLFSRDPGAFRPASPSLVHSLVPLDALSLSVPDTGLVEELLDIDHVDVVLSVAGAPEPSLRITPRMYEAICEAADFGGPVGQGVAEMNDLRSFYGRLAEAATDPSLRVADPGARALRRLVLPHVGGR